MTSIRVSHWPWRRLWLPLLLLTAGMVLASTGVNRSVLRRMAVDLGPIGPPVFVVVGTGLMCLFVPKTLVSLSAGAVFGGVMGAIVLSVTAVVSASVNYAIGRWSLAHAIRPASSSRYQRLIGELQSIAATADWRMHLLVRLMPIPTTIISYAMGASRARRRPYLLAASLASIPQWLWVGCGATATAEGDMTVARFVGIGLSTLAAIVISVIVPRQILRRCRGLDFTADHAIKTDAD